MAQVAGCADRGVEAEGAVVGTEGAVAGVVVGGV